MPAWLSKVRVLKATRTPITKCTLCLVSLERIRTATHSALRIAKETKAVCTTYREWSLQFSNAWSRAPTKHRTEVTDSL